MTRRIACLLLAPWLAACALAPPAPADLPRLASVPPAFEMSGRLALRAGERSEIGKLRWTHRPGSDVWVFGSPLGNEVARIESGPEGAVLRQGGAESQRAATFGSLTERLLGVALEPADLARWLHGGAADAGGSGWIVTVEETQDAGAVKLARRMSARRGDTTVRLVVDEYRVVEP